MVLVAAAVNLAVTGIVHALGLAGGNEGIPDRPWWIMAVTIFSQAFLLQVSLKR